MKIACILLPFHSLSQNGPTKLIFRIFGGQSTVSPLCSSMFQGIAKMLLLTQCIQESLEDVIQLNLPKKLSNRELLKLDSYPK